MAEKVRIWMGHKPTKCDLCGAPIGRIFIDGRVRSIGSWGIMCFPCHQYQGCGLGCGKGQKYKLNKETGEYECTAGSTFDQKKLQF